MMEFHPDKCEVVTVTRKRTPIRYAYHLHGHQLKHVDSVKYLGVHINKDLRWNKHINHVTTKANNSLNFIRRNINIPNIQVKEQAYKSLVRPLLEYAQVVWDPYTDELVGQLEAVQRRAARFVMNRYRRTSSVDAMITTLDWPILAERRNAARLHMFWKIQHNIVATAMPLESKGYLEPTRFENSLAYHRPPARTDYYKNSFFVRTVSSWNKLPESTVQASSLDAFKRALLDR